MRTDLLPLLMVFVLGTMSVSCRNESSGARRLQSRSSSQGSQIVNLADSHNPLAVPFMESQNNGYQGPAQSCVKLKLDIPPLASSRLDATAVVTNDCDFDVALLTEPVEVYYRKKNSDFFTEGWVIEPVYATLYIFDKKLGLGPDAFMGDGGLEVFGWPKYALLPARSKSRIRMLDTEGLLATLPKGDYGAMLVTLVGPSRQGTGSARVIDLSRRVNHFNRENRLERVGIRPGVSRISSELGFFHKQ